MKKRRISWSSCRSMREFQSWVAGVPFPWEERPSTSKFIVIHSRLQIIYLWKFLFDHEQKFLFYILTLELKLCDCCWCGKNCGNGVSLSFYLEGCNWKEWILSLECSPESQAEFMDVFPHPPGHCFRELEYQLLEQCTVDTGLAKGQSLPSVMGKDWHGTSVLGTALGKGW